MALHFTEEAFAARRAATIEAMAADGLDGLLMFRQESMYYLTGYDTFGYVFFQCLYLGADGRMMLLTRLPDLRQARHTSVVEDVRVWVDLPDANPAEQLRAILDEFGCAGRRLGVEYEAYGLTARNGRMLDAAFDGLATLADASELVSRLRVVKSAAEIEYVRKAAALADDALVAANRLAVAGAFEGDILAAMHGAIFSGGGDSPGNEFIIGSGDDALLCRYFSGRRHLDADDQITLEFGGAYRHYHSCLMRTIRIGPPGDRQRAMHEAAVAALYAVEAALKPGITFGEGFDAHARVLDDAGFKDHRMNACGYSLGTTFSPNWMDWPMLYHDNPVEAAPGMVIFVHIIIFDSERGLAMAPGRTLLVTETGTEVLSEASVELTVN